jgi:hypothetical protein
MTTATISTPAEKYLEAVERGLSDLPAEDIDEVLQDLAAHIAELDGANPEASLGSPDAFIAEFRASAGLDSAGTRSPGRARARLNQMLAAMRQSGQRLAQMIEPLAGPITRRSDEIRIAWIWSRGLLGLAAFVWISHDRFYGNQGWLLSNGLVLNVIVVASATALSVWLAGKKGTWWQRTETLASIGIGGLILLAIISTRYVPYPEEVYQETFDQSAPVLLIGPNGPIQNIYAYDTAGNPVQVLLYDEYGNPLQTLPEYAYDEAEMYAGQNDPFIWEGYEVRFATDTYGRPIGNLFPLERYEWTETGARSAPQPPPVVGIPALPEPAADGGAASETDQTSPASPQDTTTTTVEEGAATTTSGATTGTPPRS